MQPIPSRRAEVAASIEGRCELKIADDQIRINHDRLSI
jgi:hypothetical protein